MANSTNSNFSFIQRSETWLSATFLITLVVLIVPLPTFLLDMLLACNLAAATMLLLVTLGAKKPLELSVFPSMLLLLTLFRLSLNVATTRLILLNADAGKIVTTFGNFVVGGSLIVGIVIFLILVIIQFIVITKGATRISEVNARFTLDALPGKQMAIDAELNSGAINDEQAKKRRHELTQEAEFYGAMDGASKYVRGDAIAGLVIMVVNIIGGVSIGLTQGQSVLDALQLYSILTIGDGLVSQIPALIIATSAGVLVTKSSSESNLGDEIGLQVSQGYRAASIAAVIMVVISFTPGFPKIPFLLLGGVLLLFASRVRRQNKLEQQKKEDEEKSQAEQEEAPAAEQNLEEFLQNDRILIEIGAGLIPMIDPKKGNGIAKRISNLRKEMAKQNGFWMPQARIRDNLEMDVNGYSLKVCGREVGRGILVTDHYLAINPGGVKAEIPGEKTSDPAFGLDAIWTDESNRRRAELLGYTVVDAATVLVTHLGECLRHRAHELLSREDMHNLLEQLKESAPNTVGEVTSDTLRPSLLHQVLLQLLRERVPISALESIVEAAIFFGPSCKTTIELTEKIRSNLGHLICNSFRGADGRVRVIILEPKLEHYFRQVGQEGVISLDPASLQRLVEQLQQGIEGAKIKNEDAAVLVDSTIRHALWQTISRSLPAASVVAYGEVPNDLIIDPIKVVMFDDVIEMQEGPAEAMLHEGQPRANDPPPGLEFQDK